jgi:hypothetical protein
MNHCRRTVGRKSEEGSTKSLSWSYPIQFYFPKLAFRGWRRNLVEALRPDPALFQDRLLADRANLIIPASPKIVHSKLGRFPHLCAERPSIPSFLHLVVATLWPNAVVSCTLSIHSECPGFVTRLTFVLFHRLCRITSFHRNKTSTRSEGLPRESGITTAVKTPCARSRHPHEHINHDPHC